MVQKYGKRAKFQSSEKGFPDRGGTDPEGKRYKVNFTTAVRKTQRFVAFHYGVNNGIRAGDLLNIKVGDVQYLKPGQIHQIIESKTKKKNVVVINKSVRKALDNYLSQGAHKDDGHYLFQSRKGENSPLSVQSVHGLIKKWTQAINLKGNYGTHTLRKTWDINKGLNSVSGSM